MCVDVSGDVDAQVIPKAWINNKDREKQLVNEFNTLQRLDSPFCVKLHAAFQNRDALFFLMDYVGGQSSSLLLNYMSSMLALLCVGWAGLCL